MADPQHKVVKLPSGEVIAFPGSMPDAHVAGLITAFRQGKFNSPEYGQVHTGNLHAQVSPKTTDNSEHLRQSGDTTPQLPAPSWNELRQYVNDKTQPTVLPPLQGKLNASQSAQDIAARQANFTNNTLKRAGRFMFGVVDMVPQTASTLVNLFSSDPKVSQQAESDLLSMHPGAQISDRGKEFLQDWKQSPALAGSNLTGDALGFYLAGRMGPHDISAVPVKDIPSRFRTRKIYSGPLGDVRVGTDRIPTIWMHPKAWDSLMGVLYPGENPGESHGMSLGADHNLLKLAQDRGLSQTPEFKEVQTMLEKAHREAQGQADSVAIGVKREKGFRYAVRAMREERNHAWQRSLSQNKSIYTHLSPQGFDDVKKSIPGSMSAHLEFEGYDANSAPEMVSESAARFIGGELRGSTPEEAGEFLDRYFQQAVKEHGPKALETLEHVRGEGAKAKERINAEHNASEQGATRTGVPEVATGRQGGAGATPEGGTGQTGTTAPEVALNRNKGDKRDFPLLGVSMARTAEGKVKLGANAAALGKILGSSLYKSDAPKVITKELIQNAMDAVRESTGDKNVTVEIFNGTYPPLPRGKVVPHPDAANFPDRFAIQNPDGSYVHTTWIDSPNEIRPWKYDYDAEYALNALSPHRDNGAKAIRITDTGIGMTKHQLETVFTDLGASGKRDMEEASGGFGLAKAAPLMMSQQLDVSTVVNEGGKLMRHSFSATPEDLLGSGVDIKSEELPAGSVSTGTTITSILPKEADMYGARGFIGQSNISLRPPGHVKFFVDQKEMEPPIRDDVQTTPIATRDVPGAKLDLYTSYKKNDNPMGRYGGMAVEIHNNGVYQLTQHVDVPEGVRGLPTRAAIDVRATVPEGHNDYPFTANREELRGMLDDAIRSFIKEKIVNPVAEAHSRQLSEMYYSFPMINDFMPVFDSGKRLTPEEFTELTTNPAIKEISESIFMLTGEARAALEKAGESNYRMEGFGQKTKRVGIILSEDVHGVHITNPDDRSHATIFINPFDDPYEHGPDEIASLIWHTIKHELGHDKVAGHTEEFTTAEKNISRALGKMEIKALNELRSKYANPDEPDTIRPEFDRAFQIYKDSRRREETAPDIFRGEESNTGVAKTGGAQAGDGGVRDRGEGSFSDKLQSLKKEVEARNPRKPEGIDKGALNRERIGDLRRKALRNINEPALNRDTSLISDSDVDYWTRYTGGLDFKSEQEARDWLFRKREHIDETQGDLFGRNGTEKNRKIADTMPLYRENRKWKIGQKVKPVVSKDRLGSENPDGRAPNVSWYKQDLQDSSRQVTPQSILNDYNTPKDRKAVVYQSYIPIGDMPDPVLAEEQDEDGGSYAWDDFHHPGSPPPAKVLIRPDGKVILSDGNHRTRFWIDNGYDAIPAWVIDQRRGIKIDDALNRERPESGNSYEQLGRLRINSDLGQENTAALVTPKGKVLVGDWHTELYKESGYGDKGGEAKFFKEGGVRIRAQNNESHIEFSQIDPATVERVTNAIHALPGREVTLEYMPLGLGKGTLFSLGDKTRALADLDMWARRRGAGPQHGSAAYWHQQGDTALRRAAKPKRIREEAQEVGNGKQDAIPPLKTMDAVMLRLSEDDQISRVVIEAIPVDVVDLLAKNGFTPEHLLSHYDMVTNALPADSRAAVARGLNDALKLAGARLRAALNGILPSQSAGRYKKILTAVRTGQTDPLIIRTFLPFLGGTNLGADLGSNGGVLGNSKLSTGNGTPPAPILGFTDLARISPELSTAQFAESLDGHENSIHQSSPSNIIEILRNQVLQNSPHKVEAPDGKTYVFQDIEGLNNFRNEAGIDK